MTETKPDMRIEKPDEMGASDVHIWGVLRRIGVDKEWKLAHRVKDNRRDVYSIGRNPDCDIVIPDSRVSPIHCLIFCDYSDESLTMCISDCSETGTFVNDALYRVTKGERTELKSGDEIFLMNPRFVDDAQGLVSFIFINMRDRLLARKKITDANSNPNTHSTDYRRRIEDLYVVGDQIGSGMCGQVHICTHKASRVQYAVKIIDTKKFSKTPGLSPSELRQEAEMMKGLHHPNIIRIKDTFETTHRIFIVMELVTGGDLFDRIIERGRYPESAARAVMSMLLEAVRYLHDNDIVHRDLKPENILLVDSSLTSQIKITDFGLAKRASQEGLKTFCGTPQYFAPEVLERRAPAVTADPSPVPAPGARYGFKADMWSLGVVLFIMLSGAFPFDEELLYDQLKEAKYSLSGPQWSTISSDAKRFVRALMTLNPADRLDVRQALEHPWMAAGTSHRRPDSFPPPSSIVAPRDTSSRHPPTAPAPTEASGRHSTDSEKSSSDGTTTSGVSGGADDPPMVALEPPPTRKKTFCPVFWSARRQISATVRGAISCGQAASGGPVSGGTEGGKEFSGAGGGGPVSEWYEEVECCEGDDDIDEFSSDEEGRSGADRRGGLQKTGGRGGSSVIRGRKRGGGGRGKSRESGGRGHGQKRPAQALPQELSDIITPEASGGGADAASVNKKRRVSIVKAPPPFPHPHLPSKSSTSSSSTGTARSKAKDSSKRDGGKGVAGRRGPMKSLQEIFSVSSSSSSSKQTKKEDKT